ncbi:hypothetical protein [Streptomyces bathyalis]|uniref:hypothetical protein n=1 Tax=Streptomyces bathyalis TaxID=2710756 RepID=UPI0018D06A23|nr:hypothetical protein [Streptomyces bathyalis]
MRIVDVRARNVPISRYADLAIQSGGLTTTIVAVVTDAVRDGCPVVGFGFSSFGRFGQLGLIRERFAPRLLSTSHDDLATDDGENVDPFRAWDRMMNGEKPGGHGDGASPWGRWTWRCGMRPRRSPDSRCTDS